MSIVLALALAQDLPTSLSLAKQEIEDEPRRPNTEIREGESVMEYVYRNSRLEVGMMWTTFDTDLEIESDFAWFARYGVGISEILELHVTFRQYDFNNTDLGGPVQEGLLIRGLLAGVGVKIPFATDFEFAAHLCGGAMRWESQDVGFDDATGPILSGEASLGIRLDKLVLVRAGFAVDAAWSDFHASSTESSIGWSMLVGFEFGVR
jgi:hypothetical protein